MGGELYSRHENDSPKDGELNGWHENNSPKHGESNSKHEYNSAKDGELNGRHENSSPKGWTAQKLTRQKDGWVESYMVSTKITHQRLDN